MRRLLLIAGLGLLFPGSALAAAEPPLRAGVGRADITPPTGIPFGGWVRADRAGHGVHTRLYASALVLKRGGRKVALLSVDLFASPGGLVKAAADANRDIGFSERNVLVSASHTHAGPFGFANFSSINTLAPSRETITDPSTFIDFLAPRPADQELYTFLVQRIALAIRRANTDLGPAAAAWGVTRLTGVTKNRSLEAHLANHGVLKSPRQGRVSDDPQGSDHTIDPDVHVLRVDRVVRKRKRRRARRVPIGGWLQFANHGTVNPAEFGVYNNDHHGPAVRVFEARLRRAKRVPARRAIVGVYGNGNEGDQSAGLDGQGPRIAERVGRAEAEAMLAAWRQAGRRMSRRAAVDVRWTRVCFCGQQTAAGKVARQAVPGTPFFTGSEEGRGPLFEVTGRSQEGDRLPFEAFESQGHKIGIPGTSEATYPNAVPLFTVRVADRMIVSLPGEPTVEIGRRVRAAAVQASAGTGVRGAVIAGLANEFIQYLTTPEEYDRQHYEGASTMYGPASAVLLTEQVAELARRMARGQPAQAAHDFDPRNGVLANGRGYGLGAPTGSLTQQPPAGVPPGAQAVIGWQGGPRGLDRPLDRKFVTVQRYTPERLRRRWVKVADDLGLQILWTVDADGRYRVHWQVPGRARAGRYRIVVTANRYRLTTNEFRIDPRAPKPPAGDPDDPAVEFGPFTL